MKTLDAENKLHVAIIGSGSAAFACAIRAAEEGAIVSIIEAGTVGGCCVNVGCVPSKIMIKSAQFAQQQRSNPFTGIANHSPIVDRALLTEQQQRRIDELRDAKYENIIRNHEDITLIKGFASFVDQHSLTVAQENGKTQTVEADYFLIATGSKPHIPTLPGLLDTPYWTSTQALFADKLPNRLIVIGSSVIALELAQAYQRLGTKVTVLARHTLLYKEDPELGKGLCQTLENEGMRVLENIQAQRVSYDNDQFYLELGGERLEGDQLLIATGRNANTQALNCERIGVKIEKNGAIVINEKMETSLSHIYAAGDCTAMPQFVYVAAAAGTRAAINMTGGNAAIDLRTMPAVIFTDPQVATVGLSEAQAKQAGIKTESRTLALENVPRALVNFDTDGFIKLVINAESRVLIGAQILAHDGGEVIQTAALAMYNAMTIEALAGQLFPYLTMVEGLKLCAQTFNKDVSLLSCCAG